MPTSSPLSQAKGFFSPLGRKPSLQVCNTNNLKRFIHKLTNTPKPYVLDLGRLCGSNIEWLIKKGYKVYVDDRITQLKPPPKPKPTSRKGEWKFISPPPLEPLEYSEGLFDGIICWDLWDYLVLKQAKDLVSGISSILKTKGVILSYFNFNKTTPPPPTRYHIESENQMAYEILPPSPVSRRIYENREIEEIFTGFEILNSTFLKNQMREVLIQKKMKFPSARPRGIAN